MRNVGYAWRDGWFEQCRIPELRITIMSKSLDQLPDAIQRFVETLAGCWDLDPQRLAAELAANPDRDEIDRRIELLCSIATRVKAVDEAMKITDTGKRLWIDVSPDWSTKSLKSLLGGDHSECLLDSADDFLFEMTALIEGISVPGIPTAESMEALVKRVFPHPSE